MADDQQREEDVHLIESELAAREMAFAASLIPVVVLFIAGLLAGCHNLPIGTDKAEPALSGKPSWFPLGREVYQEYERFDMQKQTLSIVAESRWFGFEDNIHPYPEELTDVPLVEDGARLALSVTTGDDPAVLSFVLTLESGTHTLGREVEHRWTNVVPFLFAFFSDGKAIEIPTTGGAKMGGVRAMTELVEKGTVRTWAMKVETGSILALLPNDRPQMVSVVAAFGERQHTPFFDWPELVAGNPVFGEMGAAGYVPHVAVRSNVVHLRWTGERFQTMGTTAP